MSLLPCPASVRLASLLVPLCLLSLSCHEEEPTPPGPPAADEHAVTGHRTLHRRLETEVVRTVDNTGVLGSLSVLVPTGESFETRSVVVTGAETFHFPEVPQGVYYLKRGTAYVVTEHRELDLDEFLLGREGVITVSAALPVTLNVMGLAPLGAGAGLEVLAPNAGAVGELVLSPAPPPGSTELAQQAGTYRSSFGRQEVIDGAKGDRLYLLQKERRTAEGFQYEAISRALTLTGVTLRTEGAPTPLGGVFGEAPARQLTVDWRRSSFEAHREAVHPLAATSVRHSLLLTPAVGGLAQGAVGYAGELVSGSLAEGSEDVTVEVSYGNPYPLAWGTVASVIHRYQVPVRLAGTTGTVAVALREQAEVGAFTAGPVQARLSPPRGLRVDGENAQEDRALGSLTPVFTWEAPAVGTADAYEVRIFRLYLAPGDPSVTFMETVATFLTARREVRLPPGVLEAGQSYVARVGALRTPGVDLTRAPYQLDTLVEHSLAESVTSVLRTP